MLFKKIMTKLPLLFSLFARFLPLSHFPFPFDISFTYFNFDFNFSIFCSPIRQDNYDLCKYFLELSEKKRKIVKPEEYEALIREVSGISDRFVSLLLLLIAHRTVVLESWLKEEEKGGFPSSFFFLFSFFFLSFFFSFFLCFTLKKTKNKTNKKTIEKQGILQKEVWQTAGVITANNKGFKQVVLALLATEGSNKVVFFFDLFFNLFLISFFFVIK